MLGRERAVDPSTRCSREPRLGAVVQERAGGSEDDGQRLVAVPHPPAHAVDAALPGGALRHGPVSVAEDSASGAAGSRQPLRR